jgi:hypothetical protein
MKKGAMSQRKALGTVYKIKALESGYKLCLVTSTVGEVLGPPGK